MSAFASAMPRNAPAEIANARTRGSDVAIRRTVAAGLFPAVTYRPKEAAALSRRLGEEALLRRVRSA